MTTILSDGKQHLTMYTPANGNCIFLCLRQGGRPWVDVQHWHDETLSYTAVVLLERTTRKVTRASVELITHHGSLVTTSRDIFMNVMTVLGAYGFYQRLAGHEPGFKSWSFTLSRAGRKWFWG